MVSNVRELFRRGARDETFGLETGIISMLVKLDRLLRGAHPSVMAGLRPGPSTSSFLDCRKDVDARHKAGHDGVARQESLRAIAYHNGPSPSRRRANTSS